jgi:isoleucyl-tRNA synthetase
MKFATSGLLYRGSKPVMWSVVEQTALAEAEVEYHDYQSIRSSRSFRWLASTNPPIWFEAQVDSADEMRARFVSRG